MNTFGDVCAYLTQITDLYFVLNFGLSLMLLIVTINNTVAYSLFIRVVRKYFKETLAEERKQLTIVFSVFFGVVMIVMVISFTFGYWGAIVSNVTGRRFLENTFSLVTDFPCIFVILYFHHINYRPVILEATLEKTEPEMEFIVPARPRSSINNVEEPIEVEPVIKKNSLSQTLNHNKND